LDRRLAPDDGVVGVSQHVWLAPARNRSGVFHTDPECPKFQRIENPRRRQLQDLPNEYRECADCSADHGNAGGSHAIYRAAVAHGEGGESA
jgi:hypothetical protein